MSARSNSKFPGILRTFAAIAAIGFISVLNIAGQPNGGRAETGNYKIGPGDILKVLVLKQDILTQDAVRVNNDGTIQMPMIESPIPAACLTEDELASDLTARYKKYILNPQIYVSVREFNANYVAVVGAVVTPGRFRLQRPMRLLELLTFVNGPTMNAGQQVQLIRDLNADICGGVVTVSGNGTSAQSEAGKQEIITISLTDLLKGDESANPYVQAGDVIRIDEADVKQAFIIGNVKAATTINLKEPVTLSRAIAMAGGTASGAQINKIKISRQSSGSLSKTEIIADLKAINSRKQEDIVLEPNDIVDVPGPSGARKFFKDIIRGVVPVVTRMPIMIP